MGNIAGFWTKSFNFNWGTRSLAVPYIQAAAVVFLLFLLILTMAQFRRHYVDWSLKGAVFGVFFGFLLALILEGFLIIGGKTALTSVLGWKDAPKPIQLALDAGRNQLIKVLGIQTAIPSSLAKDNSSVQSTLETIQSLNPAEVKTVKSLICQP